MSILIFVEKRKYKFFVFCFFIFSFSNNILFDFYHTLVDLNFSWIDAYLLRFLQSNKFKIESTLKAIKQKNILNKKYLPPKMNENVREFLESGIIYLNGRDNQFRPIIFINPSKIDVKVNDFIVLFF